MTIFKGIKKTCVLLYYSAINLWMKIIANCGIAAVQERKSQCTFK